MTQQFELAFYILVYFLPYLLLELLAFRRSLRFSVSVTAGMVTVLSLLQVLLALLTASAHTPGILSFAATVFSGLFFLVAVKDVLGKKLFLLFMIASNGNVAITAAECFLVVFLPEQIVPPYSWIYSSVLLGMELMILCPIGLYVRKNYARSADPKRQFRAWNYLWVIPCMFYTIWFCLFRFGPESLGIRTHGVLFFGVTLMLCLGGIFVYGMVSQLIQEHVQNAELQEKEFRLSMQQAQYEHLQERIYEARKAKHDLHHHIHLASAYLNDGKLEELKTYLHKFSETIPDDTRISYCDHYAANALLMYFDWQTKVSGVQYSVSVDLPADVGLPDEVLTVVLGNLLENALTACREELGVPPPRISVRGKSDDGAVFFQIANTCTRKRKRDSFGQYPSTKSGGLGLGLSSVKDIAEQYDGLMEITQSGGLFTVSIMLTVPEDQL